MKKEISNENGRNLSLTEKIRLRFSEFSLLLNSVPPLMLILFVLSVFFMNLMANKSINLPYEYLALDCGLVVSWLVFLVLDIITKHFGPKAATELSIFAMVLNLGLCGVFYLVSIIPGTWGESYVEGSEEIINTALNNTFGGTWYVILGSAVAFAVSSIVNNFVNYYVGRAFKKNPDGIFAFLSRSYVSTAIGQFTDNFVFAMLVSRVFFGWSLIQCINCSIFGMVAELLCECIFSYFGFGICRKWKENKVGEEYLTKYKVYA